MEYAREPGGGRGTAGGSARAWPLRGDAPFMVVNADIWTDVEFGLLATTTLETAALLVVVSNPDFHPDGDFTPAATQLRRNARNTHTFSGIGLYQPDIFHHLGATSAPLAPILFQLAEQHQLGGLIHTGRWFDIGTPERLSAANSVLTTLLT